MQYEEEISSAEVDRVLETLSDLMENVESETVHDHLEEAYNQVFSLVYDDEEVTDDGELASADEDEDEYEDEEYAEYEEIEVDDEGTDEKSEAA